MDNIGVIFTRKANALDVWLDDPKKEAFCPETGVEVIFKRD